MDKFDGAVCRWHKFHIARHMLLLYRLQGLPQGVDVAESLWYELHCSIYADADYQFPKYPTIAILRLKAIYRGILQPTDYLLADRNNLPDSIDNVSQKDFLKSVTPHLYKQNWLSQMLCDSQFYYVASIYQSTLRRTIAVREVL